MLVSSEENFLTYCFKFVFEGEMELSVEKVRYRMSPSTIITPAFSEMSKNPLSSLSSSLDTAALFEQTDFWKGRDLEEMTVGEALGVDSSKTLGNIRSWIEKAILEEDKKKVVERKKRNLERMVEEIHKKKSTRSWESAEQRESGAHLHGEKGTGKPSSDFETREEGEGEFEGKEVLSNMFIRTYGSNDISFSKRTL